MKQTKILRTMELFNGSDIVRRFTFKTMGTRDNCALMAVENHILAMSFASISEESVHFQEDCFECLSPYRKVPACGILRLRCVASAT